MKVDVECHPCSLDPLSEREGVVEIVLARGPNPDARRVQAMVVQDSLEGGYTAAVAVLDSRVLDDDERGDVGAVVGQRTCQPREGKGDQEQREEDNHRDFEHRASGCTSRCLYTAPMSLWVYGFTRCRADG